MSKRLRSNDGADTHSNSSVQLTFHKSQNQKGKKHKAQMSSPMATSTTMTTRKENVHDMNIPQPKLFDYLYDAHKHEMNGEDAKARQIWIKAADRARKCRVFGSDSHLEVEYKMNETQLPLHLAIEQAAPYHVVRALAEVYPDACEHEHDMLPVHLACAHFRKKLKERLGEKALDLENDPDSEAVIRLLVKMHPRSIGVRGGAKDSTALHLVLTNKPSVELVEFMVKCYEDTINDDEKVKSIFRVRDKDDQLPLHVAVENQASDEVVHFIHNGYVGATRVARVKHDGFYVLHCAVLFGDSEKCLTEIMESFPDALAKVNNNSQTPLHMLFTLDNKRRWLLEKNSRDSRRKGRLSGMDICKLLLRIYSKYQTNKDVQVKKILKKRDAWGETVSDSAKKLKEDYPVPDNMIKFLEAAEAGKYSTLLGQQNIGVIKKK